MRIILYGFFITFFSIGGFIFYKYIKPGTFNIKMIIPILLFLCVLAFFDLRNTFVENKFIKTKFNSTIVDSFEWKPKVIEFTFNNGIKVSSSYGDFDIQIGDSVAKQANTSVFDVYRKDYNGIFVFYKKYDYNK